MKWEIVIGLEVHAQLSTSSKIFSGASTAFGAEANTQACAVDLALPGVLPVLNRGAVERAIKFGLAVGAHIAPRSVFSRKNYFYPDLPKGYQISQFDLPIIGQGVLTICVPETTTEKAYEKLVRLTRAHLEEDAGKSLHEDFRGMTGIDLNRAGTPLLEIVSEPDMRSATEAVIYAKMLHTLVRWIGICDGNMQEGSLRFDANVSVRRPGAELGARREIKNLNSFRFLQQAIEYEAQWQIDTLEAGGKVQQATVLFDSDKCETRAMRSKEAIDADWIERVRKTLPELPLAKRARYVADLDLSAYDADTLTSSREMADLFEATLSEVPGEAKLCANWLMGDVSASLNREDRDVAHCPISPQQLGGVLKRIVDGTISNFAAKEVFKTLWSEGGDPDVIIEEKGLKQISDVGTLEAMIDKIIADNAAQVAEYRSGKEKVFGFFVGLAMKASKGSANPAQMQEILKRKLSNQK